MFKKKFKVREGDSGGKQLIDKSHSQVVESGRFQLEFGAENLKPRSADKSKSKKTFRKQSR